MQDAKTAAQPSQQLEDSLVAACARHAPFLFQISGASYNDEAFLRRAIKRYTYYTRFVALTSHNVTDGLAPPMDVDLIWHTHLLRGAAYEAESAAMRCPSCSALGHARQ